MPGVQGFHGAVKTNGKSLGTSIQMSVYLPGFDGKRPSWISAAPIHLPVSWNGELHPVADFYV
jgi:hypothetical protein